MKKKLLDELKSECERCTRCELFSTRTNIVFGDGNPDTAKVVLIGEAPGENEDLSGKPFVGYAGKILSSLLEKAGINRATDIYIINTLKCRPPENRNPKKSEKKLCEEYLLKQIEIINPKALVLCGSAALSSFNSEKIKKIRGEWIQVNGINAMPILHPASKRYIKGYDEMTLSDLIKVSEFINK